MDYPITDINCMLGTPPERLHFTDLDGLYGAMTTYRITRAVAYHADTQWDAWRGNEAARATAAASDGRLQACYVLRPHLGGSEMPPADALLARLRAERPAAVRLFPARDMFPLATFFCAELLEALDTLAMPVIVDADQLQGYERLPALVEDFSHIRWVITRPSFRHAYIILPFLRRTETVFFDASILCDAGLIEEIVDKGGSERLLFGSGMPRHIPSGALGLLLFARISDDDRARILAGNWDVLQEGIRWQ